MVKPSHPDFGSGPVVDPSGGANQTRVRAYNERLVLSLVRRHQHLSKAEIAKRSGLSAQTVSVIVRALEADKLLLRGEPQRGRVGQPSVPLSLNPDGAYAFGLKIGRRSADLILMDFLGQLRAHQHITYALPDPDTLLSFAQTQLQSMCQSLSPSEQKRIAGLGVAMPFEMWHWSEAVGGDMSAWRDVDFKIELSQRCPYPVFISNDASAACSAELVFGQGALYRDFAYFFIGYFIGGGIVLNHSVYTGRTGSAGAIGPLPVKQADGSSVQLLNLASLSVLEDLLKQQGHSPTLLWESDDWQAIEPAVEPWIHTTAEHLALAIISVCSVIDFEAIVLDGGFPSTVRQRLVYATRQALSRLDLQGIHPPYIQAGQLGSVARALGGASLPLLNRYLLDQNVLFKAAQAPL